jgi:hypothetical protein
MGIKSELNMNKIYKSNKTFGNGLNFKFNACVGKNGFSDIFDYQFGYQLAVDLLIESIKQNTGYIDPLIYPVLFSARHSIELFMKKTINHLEAINKMIDKRIQLKNHILFHDISILWNYLKSLASFDKRIKELVDQLDEYITDYFDIDLTGETFRYPFDTNNRHHLDDFSVINILKFEERFKEMSSIIEYINYLVEKLQDEYSVGTFICGLSRHEIEEISKKLPQKNEWCKPDFDIISTKIKSEYNITSNKSYSKILDLIKKHKEFSCNIGIINISTVLSKSDYDFYKGEYLSLVNNYKFNSPQAMNYNEVRKFLRRTKTKKIFDSIKERIQNIFLIKKNNQKKSHMMVKNDFVAIIVNKLSLESIAALCAFHDIGYFNLYSEQYEKAVNFYLNEDKYFSVFSKLADGYNRVIDIEKGIKKCGQLHLL